MPTPSTAKWPKPKSEDEFEDMVVDALRLRWQERRTTRYGRSGQAQQGVDIYAQLASGEHLGAQCKNTETPTVTMVIDEVEKAKGFEPLLAEYYIVTSADRDARLQRAVRKHFHADPALFPVEVLFWEDVIHEISIDTALSRKWWGWLADAVVQGEGGEPSLAGGAASRTIPPPSSRHRTTPPPADTPEYLSRAAEYAGVVDARRLVRDRLIASLEALGLYPDLQIDPHGATWEARSLDDRRGHLGPWGIESRSPDDERWMIRADPETGFRKPWPNDIGVVAQLESHMNLDGVPDGYIVRFDVTLIGDRIVILHRGSGLELDEDWMKRLVELLLGRRRGVAPRHPNIGGNKADVAKLTDLGLNPETGDLWPDLRTSHGVDTLTQMVRIWVGTYPGEWFLDLQHGSRLRDYPSTADRERSALVAAEFEKFREQFGEYFDNIWEFGVGPADDGAGLELRVLSQPHGFEPMWLAVPIFIPEDE